MWNRLLLLLRLRNEFDYAPPGLGPEVNHPYEQDARMRCCMHCGGGKKHKIHRQPWDEKRMAEIKALRGGFRTMDEIEAEVETAWKQRRRSNPHYRNEMQR
jgi:hypothetical protein